MPKWVVADDFKRGRLVRAGHEKRQRTWSIPFIRSTAAMRRRGPPLNWLMERLSHVSCTYRGELGVTISCRCPIKKKKSNKGVNLMATKRKKKSRAEKVRRKIKSEAGDQKESPKKPRRAPPPRRRQRRRKSKSRCCRQGQEAPVRKAGRRKRKNRLSAKAITPPAANSTRIRPIREAQQGEDPRPGQGSRSRPGRPGRRRLRAAEAGRAMKPLAAKMN